MGVELGPIDPQFEAALRKHIEASSSWRTSEEAGQWQIAGAALKFYRQAWLCRLTHVGADVMAFMVVRASAKKRIRIRRVVSIRNAPGEVDRINRKFKLDLSTENVLDYLAFYYSFTPKQDVLSRNLKRPPSQFHFPLSLAGIVRTPQGDVEPGSVQGHEPRQDDIGCLVKGAVWPFVDRKRGDRIIATKLRGNKVLKRFSGNALIQFRNGLFSADFRVTTRSGTPVLSNIDLLLKDRRLLAPREIASQDLPRLNTVRNVAEDLLERARQAWGTVLRFTAAGTWRAATVLAVVLWVISALFPLVDMSGSQMPRALLGWLGFASHVGNWADALFAISFCGIFLWLAGIVYFTQMEKVFNAIFRVCPPSLAAWLAGWFEGLAQNRDRALTARDTLLKRSRYTLALFLMWAGYLILAFASLQIALGHMTLMPGVAAGLPQAPPSTTLWSLIVQAVLNVPIFFFVLYRLGADLIPHESLHPRLVAVFHVAIAAVVVKGVYRIWALSSEASPRNFIRRLMARND